MGLWISGNVAARNQAGLGSIPVAGNFFSLFKILFIAAKL
jgi:hypothetical protein